MCVSHGEVSDAAIAEAKPEEEPGKMMTCVSDLSSKVKKVWDYMEHTSGPGIGCIPSHNLNVENFHTLKGKSNLIMLYVLLCLISLA